MAELTAVQRSRARKYWPTALRMAEQFGRRCLLPIDWDGIAAEALCQVAATWRPGCGSTFGARLNRRVHGACVDAIRAHRALRRGGGRTTSLDAPREWGGTLAGLVPADELPVGWEVESEDEVHAILRRLRPTHRHYLTRLCLDAGCHDSREAARRLGVHPSRIFAVKHDSLQTLREVLSA